MQPIYNRKKIIVTKNDLCNFVKMTAIRVVLFKILTSNRLIYDIEV